MPGFEVINFKEEKSLKKIFSEGKGVLFRHGFEKLRGKSYQVRDFEKNFSKKFNMLFIFKVRDPIDSLGLRHEKEQVHLFLSE